MEHHTHRKKVWVVGRAHPRRTSSVVVTSVQVIQIATSWPASRLRMNLFDQMLENRAQKLLKNTNRESNRTLGLEIPSAFTDRVVGSSSVSNSDGTGEGDCCSTSLGIAMTRHSVKVFDEHLCRRDGSPMERIWTAILLVNSTTRTNS